MFAIINGKIRCLKWPHKTNEVHGGSKNDEFKQRHLQRITDHVDRRHHDGIIGRIQQTDPDTYSSPLCSRLSDRDRVSTVQ